MDIVTKAKITNRINNIIEINKRNVVMKITMKSFDVFYDMDTSRVFLKKVNTKDYYMGLYTFDTFVSNTCYIIFHLKNIWILISSSFQTATAPWALRCGPTRTASCSSPGSRRATARSYAGWRPAT